MTNLSELADVAWRAVAGLAGAVVYLILKKQLAPKQALGICIVAVITAIFMGDVPDHVLLPILALILVVSSVKVWRHG